MEAYYNCLRCKNRRVRILTTDGRQHEGVITDVDRYNVYLRTGSMDLCRLLHFLVTLMLLTIF